MNEEEKQQPKCERGIDTPEKMMKDMMDAISDRVIPSEVASGYIVICLGNDNEVAILSHTHTNKMLMVGLLELLKEKLLGEAGYDLQ